MIFSGQTVKVSGIALQNSEMFSYSTTVQFWRYCCVIQQMALLHSTAVLHFICSTRLLAETTPSVGFQNPIFVWREAQKTLVLWPTVCGPSKMWENKNITILCDKTRKTKNIVYQQALTRIDMD